MKLRIRTHTGRYRDATRNEIMEAAAQYVRSDLRGRTINGPSVTVSFLREALQGFESERFCAMWLDNRHRVIDFETLFTGTIDGTSVYPREVVKRALELNAAAVIVAHNHPSGNPSPSAADEQITRRLKNALGLVDIRLLDHVVIGSESHTSLAARGQC